VAHVEALPATVDRVAQTISLGSVAVLAVLLFGLAFRPAPAPTPARTATAVAADGVVGGAAERAPTADSGVPAADGAVGGAPAADGAADRVTTVPR
jgi:uncharacterized membrane protein